MRCLVPVMCIAMLIASRAAPAQGNPSAASDFARLQGRYKLISGVGLNGKRFGPEDLKGSVRIMAGDHLTVTLAGRFMLEAQVTMNPDARPKTMEYHVTKGSTVGMVFSGLYELRGDTVRLCFGRPDGPRPTRFKPAKDQTFFVWVLDRGKAG